MINAAQVTTQELRVEDSQGRVRVRSTVAENGEAVVSLMGANNRPLLTMGVRQDGLPTVEMRDNNGASRILARVTTNGIPLVDIFDAQGNDRL